MSWIFVERVKLGAHGDKGLAGGRNDSCYVRQTKLSAEGHGHHELEAQV